ncbi:hypothetical protein GCM10027270_30220 [Nocardioides ginkgobilobae]
MTDSPTGPVDGPPTAHLALAPPRLRARRRTWRRRHVLRTLDVVKGAVLGAVITIGATAHVSAEPATPAPRVDTALEQLMTDHRCTTTGFPDGSVPASTLLRNREGQLRVVSFERGWAAYQGAAPGALVAVCLDPR